MKTEFKTKDGALKAARDLKNRFPRLQVKVYDAEEKRSEEIELPAAWCRRARPPAARILAPVRPFLIGVCSKNLKRGVAVMESA
jgi:hypothetical protein